MQKISSWATKDRNILLYFHEEVLTVFASHVQHSEIDTESGGILLGRIRGQNLEITEATSPSVHDKRSRFFFERLSENHRLVAEERWHTSGGTVHYLGEWHTHPEEFPSPSSVDQHEWKILAGTRKDGRPLLTVIVGLTSMHIALVPARGPRIKLVQVKE